MKCVYCNHCKQIGRQRKTRYGYGKKRYWCEHSSVNIMDIEAFGNSARGFIGFGENTLASPLILTTSKRWCPLKNTDIA